MPARIALQWLGPFSKFKDGGRKSFTSVRRYEKNAFLNLTLSMVSASQRYTSRGQAPSGLDVSLSQARYMVQLGQFSRDKSRHAAFAASRSWVVFLKGHFDVHVVSGDVGWLMTKAVYGLWSSLSSVCSEMPFWCSRHVQCCQQAKLCPIDTSLLLNAAIVSGSPVCDQSGLRYSQKRKSLSAMNSVWSPKVVLDGNVRRFENVHTHAHSWDLASIESRQQILDALCSSSARLTMLSSRYIVWTWGGGALFSSLQHTLGDG